MIARNGRSGASKANGDAAEQTELPLFERLPPQNLEAEMAVLGSILIDPKVIDDVCLIVRPKDFYATKHSQIFATMITFLNEGKRVDAMLLRNKLKRAKLLEEVGGVAYLAELAEIVPTAHNACHYAQLVRDAATLRALVHAGAAIARLGYEDDGEPRERLRQAESEIFEILDQRGSERPQRIGDVLVEALAEIDERVARKELAGLRTGFRELDSATGGLRNGELIVVAGRPGMGKSAFALNLADHIGAECERTVLFVSLEMTRLELAERLACCRARVNSREAKNGTITDTERARLVEACNRLSDSNLFIEDAPGRNMTEIASLARRAKREDGLALIVIDYLQLIEPENKRDPREQQVSQIARRLKLLAREVNVPVVCLAQLNREADKRTDHRPRLSDLRESGAIEQDADHVWFIHRDEYYATSDEEKQRVEGQADVIIAKQRGGELLDVKLAFLKVWTLFENLAAEYQAEF